MLINWKERHRRMMEREERAWAQGSVLEGDEGLRETYEQLPRLPLRLIVCPLNKEVNHGGMLRVAEAFRVERVYFAPEEDRAVDGSGHRGTKRWQPHEWIPVPDAIAKCLADGFHLIALSLSDRTVNVEGFSWPFPAALVVGSELDGIAREVEAQCEASIAIPVYGLVQSLNVATATAMALQEAVRAYRANDPSFEPARYASRRLMGLPVRDDPSSSVVSH